MALFYSATSILDFIKQDQYYNYHHPPKKKTQNFFAVQWLGLVLPLQRTMGDTGSIPGVGNKILHVMQCNLYIVLFNLWVLSNFLQPHRLYLLDPVPSRSNLHLLHWLASCYHWAPREAIYIFYVYQSVDQNINISTGSTSDRNNT